MAIPVLRHARPRRIMVRALWGAGLVAMGGCRDLCTPDTTWSPPVALVTQQAWKEAAMVAEKVPSSMVVIGRGGSMEPLYPDGTVLVVRRLRWENMVPGMTTLYRKDPDNPYNLVAHVLVARDKPGVRWTVQGLAVDAPDADKVTSENYVGTVVAAFRQIKPQEAKGIIREVSHYQSGTCLLRCHVQAAPPQQMAAGDPPRDVKRESFHTRTIPLGSPGSWQLPAVDPAKVFCCR